MRWWRRGTPATPCSSSTPGCPRRPARAALLDRMSPSKLVGPDGVAQQRRRGLPVEDGDALVSAATSGTTAAARRERVLTHEAVRASALATFGPAGR